jgi:hypothetical protein
VPCTAPGLASSARGPEFAPLFAFVEEGVEGEFECSPCGGVGRKIGHEGAVALDFCSSGIVGTTLLREDLDTPEQAGA